MLGPSVSAGSRSSISSSGRADAGRGGRLKVEESSCSTPSSSSSSSDEADEEEEEWSSSEKTLFSQKEESDDCCLLGASSKLPSLPLALPVPVLLVLVVLVVRPPFELRRGTVGSKRHRHIYGRHSTHGPWGLALT